ncbi:MAG: hypothetical protein ACOCWB_08335 [Bacteroidota bacterium]
MGRKRIIKLEYLKFFKYFFCGIFFLTTNIIVYSQYNIFNHFSFNVDFNPFKYYYKDYYGILFYLDNVERIYRFDSYYSFPTKMEYQYNYEKEIQKFINNECPNFNLYHVIDVDSFGGFKKVIFTPNTSSYISEKDCYNIEEYNIGWVNENYFSEKMYYYIYMDKIIDSCKIDEHNNPVYYQTSNYSYTYKYKTNNKLDMINVKDSSGVSKKFFVTYKNDESNNVIEAVSSSYDTLFRCKYTKIYVPKSYSIDKKSNYNYYLNEVIAYDLNQEKVLDSQIEYLHGEYPIQIKSYKTIDTEFYLDKSTLATKYSIQHSSINKKSIGTLIHYNKNIIRDVGSDHFYLIKYKGEDLPVFDSLDSLYNLH